MKTFLIALTFLVGLSALSADLNQPPNGLTASDWTAIRQEYERHRHAAVPEERGFRARNFRQQLTAHFDGRGFTVEPDAGRWTWGLELERYGFAGHEHALSGLAQVTADVERVRYSWGTLEEWFVNDTRGLEHGFTVRERPARGGGPLRLQLSVRGGLMARVAEDGGGVSFADTAGRPVLTYAGLKVWDADGNVLAARFEAAAKGALLLTVDETCARYPLIIDPTVEQAYLKASNTGAGDGFGRSVAISGNTVVVGAPREDSNATGVNGEQTNDDAPSAGAAYIFSRSSVGWRQEAYLKSSSAEYRHFGWSVAVSANTVIVGAPTFGGFHEGAAFVFQRSGNTWNQQAFLRGSKELDRFGSSVAVSADRVLVGAPGYRDGAVYVFVPSGIGWTKQAELAGESGFVNFGESLAISGDGDTIVVGAHKRAFVFVPSGIGWIQQAVLRPSDDYHPSEFGFSVAVSGDTVVVGDPLVGFAVVYVRDASGSWSLQAFLGASNATNGAVFGFSVAVSGYTIVVGAPQSFHTMDGCEGLGDAYVFKRIGGGTWIEWIEQERLGPFPTEEGICFGGSVAIAANTVVVAAPSEDSSSIGVDGETNYGAPDSGAAYVFEVKEEPIPPAQDISRLFTMTGTPLTLDPATGRYRQTITLVASSPVKAAAYVTDNLPDGVAMFQADGVTSASSPAGSPYKELGQISAGVPVTLTLEFITRKTTAPITYVPQISRTWGPVRS